MSATVNTAVRNAKRTSKLGDQPVCLHCGESDPVAMLYERHHVAGRANEPDLTARLCRNCHARQTEALRAGGVSMDPPSTALHRLAALLGGLAEFLTHLAASLTGWSRFLHQVIDWLDEQFPTWRDGIDQLVPARRLAPLPA